MSRAVGWPVRKAESGIDRHFKEIQRFPMLDPQDEYLLAKRWREAGDRDAAVTGSSSAICGWSPKSPEAIAATVCPSLT